MYNPYPILMAQQMMMPQMEKAPDFKKIFIATTLINNGLEFITVVYGHEEFQGIGIQSKIILDGELILTPTSTITLIQNLQNQMEKLMEMQKNHKAQGKPEKSEEDKNKSYG